MKKVMMIVGTGALMAIAPLTFTSCGKKGCTDKDAENYCSECKKDDGSCTYKSSLVIWWKKAFADSAYSNGATAIKVYVDGEYINTYGTNTYWTGAPNCGSNGSITINKDLGQSKNKSVSVVLKDQNGVQMLSSNINLPANTCYQYEIIW